MARDQLTDNCYKRFSVTADGKNRNLTDVVFENIGCWYDPRLRDWYTLVSEETTSQWTSIYEFTSEVLGVTFSTPYYVEDVC